MSWFKRYVAVPVAVTVTMMLSYRCTTPEMRAFEMYIEERDAKLEELAEKERYEDSLAKVDTAFARYRDHCRDSVAEAKKMQYLETKRHLDSLHAADSGKPPESGKAKDGNLMQEWPYPITNTGEMLRKEREEQKRLYGPHY